LRSVAATAAVRMGYVAGGTRRVHGRRRAGLADGVRFPSRGDPGSVGEWLLHRGADAQPARRCGRARRRTVSEKGGPNRYGGLALLRALRGGHKALALHDGQEIDRLVAVAPGVSENAAESGGGGVSLWCALLPAQAPPVDRRFTGDGRLLRPDSYGEWPYRLPAPAAERFDPDAL